MKKYFSILLVSCILSTFVNAANLERTTLTDHDLLIYSDQTTSFITVETSTSYNYLSVYNEQGVLLKKVMIGNAGKNKVDVGDLQNGNYSAVLSGNENGNGNFTISR